MPAAQWQHPFEGTAFTPWRRHCTAAAPTMQSAAQIPPAPAHLAGDGLQDGYVRVKGGGASEELSRHHAVAIVMHHARQRHARLRGRTGRGGVGWWKGGGGCRECGGEVGRRGRVTVPRVLTSTRRPGNRVAHLLRQRLQPLPVVLRHQDGQRLRGWGRKWPGEHTAVPAGLPRAREPPLTHCHTPQRTPTADGHPAPPRPASRHPPGARWPGPACAGCTRAGLPAQPAARGGRAGGAPERPPAWRSQTSCPAGTPCAAPQSLQCARFEGGKVGRREGRARGGASCGGGQGAACW